MRANRLCLESSVRNVSGHCARVVNGCGKVKRRKWYILPFIASPVAPSPAAASRRKNCQTALDGLAYFSLPRESSRTAPSVPGLPRDDESVCRKRICKVAPARPALPRWNSDHPDSLRLRYLPRRGPQESSDTRLLDKSSACSTCTHGSC